MHPGDGLEHRNSFGHLKVPILPANGEGDCISEVGIAAAALNIKPKERRKSKEIHYNLSIVEPNDEETFSMLTVLQQRVQSVFEREAIYPFIILGCLVLLFPMRNLSDFSNLTLDTGIEHNKEANSYLITVCCGLSAMLPLWLDTLFDFYSSIYSKCWLPRFVISTSLCITSICCIQNFSSPAAFSASQVMINDILLYILITSALYLLYIFEPDIFSIKRLTAASATLLLALILHPIGAINAGGTIAYFVIWATFLTSYFLGIILLLRKFYLHYMESTYQTLREWFFSLEYRDYGVMSMALVLSTLLAFRALVPIYAGSSGIGPDINVPFLYYCFLMKSIAAVLIVSVPSRLFKIEASHLDYDLNVKKTFVRYVSHEIRTPMNILAMGLDLIEGDIKRRTINAATVDTLQEVKGTTRTVLRILNDLLLFEKLDSGEMELDKSVVSPVEFLKALLRPFGLQARQASIAFEVLSPVRNDLDELDRVVMDVDVVKLGQAVSNFVSNALKFTPKGFVYVDCKILHKNNAYSQSQPSVNNHGGGLSDGSNHIPASQSGNGAVYPTRGRKVLRILVKDSGHGIDPSEQRRLFQEVVQFNANAHQGGNGSGLGLWLTKKIVDLHGGKVGVLSLGTGTGSTFYMDLPVVMTDTRAPREASPKARDVLSQPSFHFRIAQPSPSHNDDHSRFHQLPVPIEELSQLQESHTHEESAVLKAYHVLLVDDSALNRKMTNRTVASLGHTCEEAEDGVTAVQAMSVENREGKPAVDLIFMDNCMPNMTGPEATLAIRNLGFKGVILGLTGHVLPEDIAKFTRAGADGVLVKPITRDGLDAAINLYVKDRNS